MSRKVFIILSIWFCVAILIGVSGIFYRVPAPFVPLSIWSPVILTVLIFWSSNDFREWIYEIDFRLLMILHLTRFVGIWFLVLYSRGEFPEEFAVKGGWGDILAAVTAILVGLFFVPLKNRVSWTAVLVWNIFGFLDILLVVATGAKLLFTNYDSMIKLTTFPLNLLPLFIVPIIIATHFLIFAKLWKEKKQSF
ncbi:MAG: hypothetical protein K1X72_23180 [Pyrinomonadaceae bacterium]|nr:hypothetical protein [Pyrinomonadaceae bacterium]